jgi:hypothetical protein
MNGRLTGSYPALTASPLLATNINSPEKGALLSIHASSPFHLGGKIEEKLLAERLGTARTHYDRSIEAPVDDLGEVDVAGSQLTRGMRPAAKSAWVTLPVQSVAHPWYVR